MRKGAYLLLLLPLLLATGCKMLVKDPVVTVQDLKVVSLTGGGAGMELRLKVKNPNSFGVRLLGYSYNLTVLELPLAKGTAREEIEFPAGGEAELLIPIKISFGDLLEIYRRKPNLESIPYRLSAGLDLGTPLGKMTVPVNRNGTYAIPRQYRPPAMLNRLTDFLRMNK